ncbi:MAG: hypothetical protein ACYTG5_18545 [Planctomycetota bacterium]|jgi:hypothetical protein
MASTPPSIDRGSLAGARLGVLIGFNAWVLALIGLVIYAEARPLLLSLCLPPGLASITLSLIVLKVIRATIHFRISDPPTFTRILFGLVGMSVAALGCMANYWIMPALLDYERIIRVLEDTGSATEFHPIILITAGAGGVLVFPWFKLRARPS